MMFLSSRKVPSRPPSLVRFSSNVRGDNDARFVSTPMSDQVPELRYAQLAFPVFEVGTPATAEAVSCEGGAMTLIFPRPVRSERPGRSPPNSVPGETILGKIRVRRSNR